MWRDEEGVGFINGRVIEEEFHREIFSMLIDLR